MSRLRLREMADGNDGNDGHAFTLIWTERPWPWELLRDWIPQLFDMIVLYLNEHYCST